ncbi:MAG: hypothetical protein Ct9H300mP8_00820 [Gammaproteobacteria bacterium]|nr:MAG: hypothetical protein Ct9H300mP8_00820 [Gammaproteobacteria bacterium]
MFAGLPDFVYPYLTEGGGVKRTHCLGLEWGDGRGIDQIGHCRFTSDVFSPFSPVNSIQRP